MSFSKFFMEYGSIYKCRLASLAPQPGGGGLNENAVLWVLRCFQWTAWRCLAFFH